MDKTDIGISSEFKVDSTNEDDLSIANIALFGIDQREPNSQSHSDAIIIATVDKRHNKIKLSSIMRDSLVKIDGYGEDKLTQAFYNGGPQLAVKTINQNFALEISEYATVNFYQMAQIIDSVGGIEIDISEQERLDANNSIQEQSIIADLPADFIERPGIKH